MVIKILAAVVISILESTSALMIFNRMPYKWLLDYGESPSEKEGEITRTKVSYYPWAYLISGILVVLNLKLITYDFAFFVGGTFLIWVLTTLAICDVKSKIIPDQLVVLLLVSAIGLSPFLDSFLDSFAGGLMGFGLLFGTGILGNVIYKKAGAGGGDMKVFGAIGLSVGIEGILVIYTLSVFLTVIHHLYLKYYLRVEYDKTVPMGPSIAVATGLYLALIREALFVIEI